MKLRAMDGTMRWSNRGKYAMLNDVLEYINYLCAHSRPATCNEISDKFGMPKKQASCILCQYKKLGYIETCAKIDNQANPRNQYSITDKGAMRLGRRLAG